MVCGGSTGPCGRACDLHGVPCGRRSSYVTSSPFGGVRAYRTVRWMSVPHLERRDEDRALRLPCWLRDSLRPVTDERPCAQACAISGCCENMNRSWRLDLNGTSGPFDRPCARSALGSVVSHDPSVFPRL
jgi:hypothetical protein